MGLVEIIMGERTSQETLAAAVDYVLRIRKTPIVVNDSRGFYTSRCFGTFIQEGMELLTDGIAPAIIDNVGRATGMPRGPLEMHDDVALDLSLKVRTQTQKDLGAAFVPTASDPIIARMVTELGRYGRKNGRGFYDYPAEGAKRLWPGLADLAPVSHEDADPALVAEIRKRLLYRQAVEAARCMEENVVTSAREADVGAILGWGFAPWTGGPLSMIDGIGVATFVEECDALTRKFGARFSPPRMLREMAASGESFYGVKDGQGSIRKEGLLFCKKEAKNFCYPACTSVLCDSAKTRICRTRARFDAGGVGKSFLLLFCKKEGLPCLPYGRRKTSTRRFFCRPSSAPLSAIGRSDPNATTCPGGNPRLENTSATTPPPAGGRAPVLVVDLANASADSGQAPASTPAGGKPADAARPAAASGLNADEQFAARVETGSEPEHARATRLREPSTTAPQGTIIPAVLETALNSDLPGFARAVVSRDVRSFDGSNVLIPRGSRVIGEYRSAVALGQSRIFVVWTRVLRPDGGSIEISSGGGDTLGRAGLAGKVDRHFFEQFSGAILLTVLNAAAYAAAAGNSSTAVVVNSGSTTGGLGGAGSALTPAAIPPTIKVAQGTPIRIFVQRDLDFTPVGGVGR